MTIDYGKSGAIAERKFLHQHIISQRGVNFGLPTNVRACYYVGTQAGQWPDDATYLSQYPAMCAALGKVPSRDPRLPSQKVSDWLGWLIAHGLVGEDEIVDETCIWFGSTGVVDLLSWTLERVQDQPLDPWSPNPVPIVISEGRNDLSIVKPICDANLCLAFPLGGMSGGAQARWLAANIGTRNPIGYVGDWNKAGSDIERNTETFLKSRGWQGKWKRLAITDTQAGDPILALPHKMKLDHRYKVVTQLPSIETAAMGPAAIRTAIQDWLDRQRPAAPDADESERAEIVRWLEQRRDAR